MGVCQDSIVFKTEQEAQDYIDAKQISKFKYSPVKSFGGHTECLKTNPVYEMCYQEQIEKEFNEEYYKNHRPQ